MGLFRRALAGDGTAVQYTSFRSLLGIGADSQSATYAEHYSGDWEHPSFAVGMQMQIHTAALFVEKGGTYCNLPGVDPWDKDRDARLYPGPYPVVAHPPCQLWVNFAALNYKRWGGEHNRPGNDGGCFESAFSSVLSYGGVLEHPASSNAWPAYRLHRPVGVGWQRMGAWGAWVCEVWQSAYGHPARKRTWLFYYSPHDLPPHELDWSRPVGTHQIGKFDRIKPTVYGRAASRTPPAFRDELLTLAGDSCRTKALATGCG